IQFGVPDSVIFIEDASNNTQENAINSKRILDSLQLPPPYLLITSAFHLPRAQITFKNAGIPNDGFPCNYTDGMDSFSWDDLIPTPVGLLGWNLYLKELAGYAYYK
ncbi:MAG: YdcF family protein, partial [Ginsengibacter sp.]